MMEMNKLGHHEIPFLTNVTEENTENSTRAEELIMNGHVSMELNDKILNLEICHFKSGKIFIMGCSH